MNEQQPELKTTNERTKKYLKKAATIAGVLAVAYVCGPKVYDAGKDFVGKTDSAVEEGKTLKQAHTDYKKLKSQASPSQLFALRYTDTATLGSYETEYADGTGILGKLDAIDEISYSVGDQCLNKTAYDINGGDLDFRITVRGFLSSTTVEAEGEIPTAAAQASYDPDNSTLTIKSGNPRPDDLKFTIRGTELSPQDKHTENLLSTYGCAKSVSFDQLSYY